MKRSLAWAAALGGIWGSTSGCVNYQHNALAISLTACHDREMLIPSPIRQRVYFFALNGFDVTDNVGLHSLRDQIVQAGYPKVYLAQEIDRAWYDRECRRLRRDDPAARMVFFAVGSSANTIVELANDLIADAVTVDAVVLLDPPHGYCPPCRKPNRVIVLRSRGKPSSLPWPDAEEYQVNHHPLHKAAGSPDVVEAVVKLMTESAQRVGPIDGDPVPSLPLSDRPHPTPRGEPGRSEAAPDEWDFLKIMPRGGVPATPPENRVAPPHPILGPIPSSTLVIPTKIDPPLPSQP
jgi:hypothetical protein